MKDEQYNEYIRRQLKENEEKHFSEVGHNKNAVWEQIDERLKKKTVIPLWFYSAAAFIILMVGLGFIFSQQLNNKEQEIGYLKEQLEKQQNEIAQIKTIDKQVIIRKDTAVIEQKEIVYIPVKTRETIIKHDTVIKFVKVTDTIFIKENTPSLIAESEDKDELKLADNKAITINNESKQNKKRNRFIFLFGRPKTDVHPYESERLITLKTK